MKFKFFLIAAMAACATLFVACDDKEEPTPTPGPNVELEEAFVVRTSNVAQYSVTMNVQPLSGFSNVGYYAAITTPAQLAEYDGDWETLVAEEFWWYVDNYGMSMDQVLELLLATGSVSGSFYTLDENTEYIAFAAGFDGEGLTTAVATSEFKTMACPELEKENCTFTIDLVPTSYTVDVTVSVSNNSTAWFVDYMTAADYAQYYESSPDLLAEVMPLMMKNAASQIGKPVSAVVSQYTITGSQNFPIPGLAPSTEYVLFVCGLDKFGRATTDVAVKSFTTKEFVPSNATIKTLIRLFSNDDLVAYDPTSYPADYFPAGGYAIQFYIEEFSAEAVEWGCLGYVEDLTDEIVITEIVYNDQFSPLPDYRYVHMGGVPLNQTLYLFSVARDSAGNFGPVDRVVKSFTAGDVTDIADLRIEDENETASVRFSSFNELIDMPMGENLIHINLGERAPLSLKK